MSETKTTTYEEFAVAGDDLLELARRIAAIEVVVMTSVGPRSTELISQLDLIAEHLVGQTAHETQRLKRAVQDLIRRVSPERAGVNSYVETYCPFPATDFRLVA